MNPVILKTVIPLAAFMLIVMALFWFTVVRPQGQAQRRHREMIDNLKVGDRIITAGGVYGKVIKLTDETFTLEIAPGVPVVFDRRALRRHQD
ncbi:MAG TPA: preprotein translocase subunit YajC [Armatimonadota bacterium]|jgi:preprotein translocase subunit YajC